MTPSQTEPQAQHFDGMGAVVLGEDGVGFRVWAPHATAVTVTGDFNDWDDDATPLQGDNGYWSAVVPKAKPGDEYKYVITNGEQVFHRIDPYAMHVTNSVGNSVIYDQSAFDWEGDAPLDIPFHEMVIYELHVGSFLAPGDGPGDFDEVEKKFKHLQKLGVNVLQVMPIGEFAGDYSWGYNPAHIFAVESAYGGPDAFKKFVKAAHAHGFGVILDVVYNHLGPSDLDLWQFDGWSENDKGGIYFFNDHRSSTPWGDTRPDYGREEVRNFLRDNAYMWLRDYHVDGLRADMTPYVRSVDGGGRDIESGWEFMHWMNNAIRHDFPGRILIAEDMHQDPEITTAEGAAFHAQWDSAFVHPIRAALVSPDDAARSTEAVAMGVTQVYNGDAFQRVIYTESHDEVANGKARVPTEVDPGDDSSVWAQKRATLGAALLLTSPGIPMLFQGQEFLQGDWFRDDVPLDWDLNKEHRGIVRLWADLVKLRRNWHDTTGGLRGHHTEIVHQHEDDNVVAYLRWDEGGAGDHVLVVANMGSHSWDDYRIHLPFEGSWSLQLNSDASVYSDDFSDGPAGDVSTTTDDEGTHVTVALRPYSALIYSLA